MSAGSVTDLWRAAHPRGDRDEHRVIADHDPGDEHAPPPLVSRSSTRQSANVVPIRSSALADWLRELADRADKGEIVAGGAALVTRSGEATAAWFDPSRGSRIGLIAASSMLAHGVMVDAHERAKVEG